MLNRSHSEHIYPAEIKKRRLSESKRDDRRQALLGTVSNPTENSNLDINRIDRLQNSTQSLLPALCDTEDCEMICYGSLCEISAQIRQDPLVFVSQEAESIADGQRCILLDVNAGWVSARENEPFGCLTSKDARNLGLLRSLPCLLCDVVVSYSSMEKARLAWKRTGSLANLQPEINVYGHRHNAREVAQTLSSMRLFLQRPEIELRSVRYENPQYLKLPSIANLAGNATSDENQLIENIVTSNQERNVDIDSLLDHLPERKYLRQAPTDARITTDLKTHQKEAVDFMTRKETGDLLPSLSLWKSHETLNGLSCYQHVIVTGEKSSRVEDPSGGILADDMGLGKTLTTLAVIVGSTNRALEFALSRMEQGPSQWQKLMPSKATLVIVPSSLLLDSWTEEIRDHVLDGTLATHRYHGTGRATSPVELLQKDIVLTTYATVAADWLGPGRLNSIEWYRIVLDEAHVIRNPSTTQFRAVNALSSQMRWCLTGTPIQNSVEDLGALAKFLKIPLLGDSRTFRKYITSTTSSNQFTNLSRFLESLCLRRTRGLLGLPDPLTETHSIDLSPLEMRAYREFGRFYRQNLNRAVSGRSFKKSNQLVVEMMLRMRLFCNHGPSAFSGKWNPLSIPSDPQEALNCLQTDGRGATCAQCDGEILSLYQADDPSSGVLTICQHLLCRECRPKYQADIDDSIKEGEAQCPICDKKGDRDTFILDPTKASESSITSDKAYSTKITVLIENIQKQGTTEKCVVFSFWKKTLDVIADLLNASNVPLHRVHGSLSASKRRDILADFEVNPSIKVLLITFGTGAVGINKLVVANRIHIVEPQWNPHVESQAIGRILRIGQEKAVTIVRYMSIGTIEEGNVKLRQLRKLELARGGFVVKEDEDASRKVHELMSLVCPSA